MEVRFSLDTSGQAILVNVKTTAISLTVDGVPVYSFDLEGRLLAVYDGTRTCVRGLDDRLLEKRVVVTPAGREKRRRAVPEAEKGRILDQVHLTVRGIRDALAAGAVTARPPVTGEALALARRMLARIAAWDPPALAADGRRFVSIYHRVSILPPDQYFAVVLQATEGCPYNRCTFCTFYRGRAFRVKTPAEFREHVAAVLGFFGEGLRLRRSIFLGDANALVAPQARLLEFLDVANEAFSLPGGIYSFLDVFSARKSSAEFRTLAERGLRRVYLGIETGHDPLLRFLRKPGGAEKSRRMVEAAKAGGVAVGLVILLGAGGQRYAAAHVADTVRLLGALPLGERDIVYFSPLLTGVDSEYVRQADAEGFAALDEAEMATQEAAIRAGLGPAGPGRPRLARYDIREFVY